MGKIIETTIKDFSGGIVNDPRDTAGAKAITNFDVFTDPKRLTPYRDSESGDAAAATAKKQNFCIGHWLPGATNKWRLFGLGVVSGAGYASIEMKDLTTGGDDDLDDSAWGTPATGASASGATSFNLFVYYKKTGLVYGAKSGTHIWAFDPGAGAAFAETHQALTYTNIAQGLVHSKDDILYIPYDNKIATNNNGSWTVAALTLPTHYVINSICEYGNYLAIAAAPLAGYGKSRVFLWDRDSSLSTISESVDWGDGILKVLEEVDGVLMGISSSSNTVQFNHRIIFRYYNGVGSVKLKELTSTTTPILPIAKQRSNNRLYFMLQGTFHGAVREGVFSIGRPTPDTPFAIAHERTPNNDTALGTGFPVNFFVVGDYVFISYVTAAGAYALSKTNDTASYTASSIYETVVHNAGDPTLKKKLVGISVSHEPLPAAGQVVVKYKKDAETSFTTILTNTTDDSISKSAVNIESSGASLPTDYKEITFRSESTGGAVITGLSFQEEIEGKRAYEPVK